MLAAIASFGVMVSVNLTGYVVVDHEHSQGSLFSIIGAHVLGMYGLVLVIGRLIDRIGRATALGGGLAIMAVSCVGLMWVESVWMTAVLLGLGRWNLSFVSATAQLADATAPAERGKLLGLRPPGRPHRRRACARGRRCPRRPRRHSARDRRHSARDCAGHPPAGLRPVARTAA